MGAEVVADAGPGAAGGSCPLQPQGHHEQEPPGQPHGGEHLWPGRDGSETRRGARPPCVPKHRVPWGLLL